MDWTIMTNIIWMNTKCINKFNIISISFIFMVYNKNVYFNYVWCYDHTQIIHHDVIVQLICIKNLKINLCKPTSNGIIYKFR